MSDMVERVARALLCAADLDPDVFKGLHGNYGHWEEAAQAAITAMQADADLERIKRERDQAVEALRPFAEYGKWAVDENGWDLGSPRERLCDWFGPSDFHRAATTLASIEGADHE